jgi:acetyl/propionyl-CoA carboxylase alpha subunit
VDSGVAEGSTVPAAYDSLIAKLLVWAPDRRSAVALLRRALDELEVTGLQTDLPFLRHVAADPLFEAGGVDTGYIDRTWDPAPQRQRAATAAALAAGLLAQDAWQDGGAASTARPVPPADGPWRSEGRREATERWP